MLISLVLPIHVRARAYSLSRFDDDVLQKLLDEVINMRNLQM